MPSFPVGDLQPQQPAFCAPTASLVGDVRFGPGCSVWFGAVLRGDIAAVMLGAECNVQDNCVLHVAKDKPCRLADRVSMGHQAIAHACTVGSGSLLGMGCRVLDDAELGEGVLVAAGTVVKEGMQIPPHYLVAGVPGRIIGPLRAEQRERIARIAGDYLAYQALYPELLG
jgi:carbonic anhydrase/acetyltransferase-like protein (isoleucine patch superfamily)